MSVDTMGSTTDLSSRKTPRRMPPENVARSIGGMVGDIVSLSELQLKLLKRDSTEAVQRTYISIAFLVVGLLILFACLPVGMLAIVFILHEFCNLDLATSLLIVVGSGLLSGIVIASIAYFKLKKAGNIFHRSQTEFSKNVTWFKNSMQWD